MAYGHNYPYINYVPDGMRRLIASRSSSSLCSEFLQSIFVESFINAFDSIDLIKVLSHITSDILRLLIAAIAPGVKLWEWPNKINKVLEVNPALLYLFKT